MKRIIPFLLIIAFACEQKPKTIIPEWQPYDETTWLEENADHESVRMQYKLIQSKISDKNDMLDQIRNQITYFSKEDYERLTPFILEQDIPTIQSHIKSGDLTYETLTQWYLYRIALFENSKDSALNNIIAINPKAVEEARKLDKNKSDNDHLIYGIPVLLKDNVNFEGLPTTAGAAAMVNNYADDAFIVKRIKDKGGIILGKANLSEWANYYAMVNPNGYSTVGGQTLNPYGPRKFDTGGSSSGSGSAIAANYAAVAVGSETSGSILSPSSSNSIVGLKPTIGLLSRGGIIPISSTLDTPGPMTKSVIDNAIFLSAMTGKDAEDAATADSPEGVKYFEDVKTGTVEGLRFGVIKGFLADTMYLDNVSKIVAMGGDTVVIEPAQMDYNGFLTLLSGDMKYDLPHYFEAYAGDSISYTSVADIVEFNKKDTTINVPYGQGRLEEIVALEITMDSLIKVREEMNRRGKNYFEVPMQEHNLDVILSINNWTAGQAAVAKYPCLTVPMGYTNDGQPKGITFIAKPFEEAKLLKVGYAYEQTTKLRQIPKAYH
ncbi:amidase family protein [Fulvivirga lutimaris]|uniref:amidase family protein n=1 Tax=Fulvivirga lutimaris TaxID=1819566 RepID=UPI0012BBD09E|nr:amidase family protein [Fulvivirga lutimaris]MTI41073.1 amidase [Fulvivirga lutimaris]